jgi:hypothetical protein
MDENQNFQLHIGLFNNEGLFVLDTENKNFLSKCYLAFHNEEINNIENLFDELIFSYNEVNSKISSEFLHILLNLNSEDSLKSNLNKFLYYNDINKSIFFPLHLFFAKKNVYIKNQQVSFRLINIKKNIKIELLYEILESSNHNQSITINNKIPIENFYILNVNLYENISIKLIYNLQDIFWVYKNNEKFIHPVSEINIKVKTIYNNIIQIVEPNFPNYFTYIQQYIYHTSPNIDLYNYSFQLNPNFFDHKQCLSLNAEYIIFEQKIKDEYKNVLNNKQIICLKSISFAEMITEEKYQKLKKLKHLFYSLKLKNRFRNWLWERVRQKHAQITFHPNNIIKLLEEGVDILKMEEFLPSQNY